MSGPGISIITPSYNCARFLPGCLASVESQSYPHREHLVMDGGSTDGTRDLLLARSGLRWRSGPDRGMYDAINRGIAVSSGEVLAYLNCDDRYCPGALERVARAFAEDPELDFVYGQCEYIDEGEKLLFVLRPLPYWINRGSLRILWPQPSFFWRRRVHLHVGFFDANLRCLGDFDFMKRLVAAGLRGRLLSARLARFMLRRDCLSAQGARRFQEERRLVQARHCRRGGVARRAAAEALFALWNLPTYPHRLRYRRWFDPGSSAPAEGRS